MKTVVLLAVFVSACLLSVFADDYEEYYRHTFGPAAEKCEKLVPGATEADVRAVTNEETLNTYTAKCVQLCAYQELGFANGPDFATIDVLVGAYKKIHHMHPDMVAKAESNVQMCLDEGTKEKDMSDDNCEVAAVIQECLREQNGTSD